MKRLLCLVLAGLLTLSVGAEERKKVGLVLGGGGAKGMAHVGVLKVLEEAQIPIDYIAGTSMGAIVGGLYSIGYSAAEIDSMVREMDWADLLSDRVKRNSQSFPEKEKSERFIVSIPFGKERKDRSLGGVIRGQNLQNLFSNLTIGYHDGVDFNDLHIPFACVAMDVVNGKEKVFREGSLPTAMRASMAIPAVFTPVRLDSMVLIDGGLLNNYPADVALDMGADILIGVDLGTSDLKLLEGLTTAGDVVGQIIAILGYDKYIHNKDTTDFLLRPNMVPYNSASFSSTAIDTLIHRGEQAMRMRWDELMVLKEKIGLRQDEPLKQPSEAHRDVIQSNSFHIRHIRFEGIDARDEKWLRKLSKLHENSNVTLQALQEAMSLIVGTNAYSNVSYKLIGKEQQDLLLSVQPKPISSISAGLRFDTEEYIALMLHADVNYRTTFRQRIAFTGRVGEKSYARLDYSAGPNLLRNMNLSYMFTYHQLDLFHRGKKLVNTTYRHQLAELGYSDMNWLNFRLKVGARFEYFDYNDFLFSDGDHIYNVKPERFVNYFIDAGFENLDSRYFPRRGVALNANYTLYTDNFITYKGHTPFSALGVDVLTVIPINSHLSLLPSLTGRVLIGKHLAYPFLNTVGGEVNGRYMPQQIPFAGINNIEVFDNTLFVGRIHLRQRIYQHHYLSLKGNYGIHNDDFFSLFSGEHVWGGSLGYSFDSLAGPLNAHLGLSSRNTKVQFYLNLGFYF